VFRPLKLHNSAVFALFFRENHQNLERVLVCAIFHGVIHRRTVLQYGASIFYGLWLMAKYGFHFYGLRQIVQIWRNSHKSYIPAKYG
jgi:hypothetical protein